MATVDAAAKIGGGIASDDQAQKPLHITAEPILSELNKIYKLASSQGKEFFISVQHEDPPSAATTESFANFVQYFVSPSNNLIAPPPPTELDHPLTSYFISSSHNTYLVGHQLYGSSTAQGYINVLNRACRCIEIDVWDGDDGEPEVDHGFTLTKHITFRDACAAVGKYAFVKSDLPVIVSLECHAGMEQQDKIVEIMKTEWKGHLLDGDLEGWDVSQKGIPPPGSLKNKILVKTIFKKAKYLPPDAQPGGPNTGIQSLTNKTKDLTVEDDDEESEEIEREVEGKPKSPKVKISRALSNLGVYASAMKFAESFTDAASTRPNHVFSFSEKKFNALHEAQADALFQHNRQYLTRVYPHGLRISSTNLNPQDFWRRGAQLVALNWQKADKGMMFNEAMFAGTGGFVLKPESLLPNVTSTTALSKLERTVDLKITILAGQDLPLPEDDDDSGSFHPYVKCTVHVSQHVKHKGKTGTAGKGVNVAWGEKKGTLVFKRMKGVVEMLSFVRLKLYDDEFGRDDKSGWACIRLDRLNSGYRFVKLFNMKGVETPGVLLVKVEKTVS